jgi:hypothetical protein
LLHRHNSRLHFFISRYERISSLQHNINSTIFHYRQYSFNINDPPTNEFRLSLYPSGIEYCEWKDFPKWALTFLKWFSGITAIIFIFWRPLIPAFLIGALIGPGGMGLMYLSMLNSKSYQEMHTQYHHYAFKWEEITQLAIATNREVVDLKYSVTQEGNDFKTNWSLNVFCKRKQKEAVANFIKPYLSPDVPFIKAKVNVPMSTD